MAQGEENLSPVLIYDAVPFPLYQHGEPDRTFCCSQVSGAACAEPSAGAVMVCGGRVQLQRRGLVSVHIDVPVCVQSSCHVPAEQNQPASKGLAAAVVRAGRNVIPDCRLLLLNEESRHGLLAVHFPACQNGRIPQRNAAWNAGQHPEAAPEAGEYGADTVHGIGNWRAWLLVFHAFPRRKSMEKQNFHLASAKSGADRRVYLRHGMGIQSVPLETAGAVGGCLF